MVLLWFGVRLIVLPLPASAAAPSYSERARRASLRFQPKCEPRCLD